MKAAQAAALGDIEPPPDVFLRDFDMPHWARVVRARARAEWTEVELVIAANLSRCLGDIERISRDLAEQPDTVLSSRGTPVPNPLFAILEQLSRRVMALQRALQMQASASERREKQGPARAAERNARAAKESLQDEDDLIPMR